MKASHRRMHPLDELAIALGTAARRIADRRARAQAVLDAARIRRSRPERFDKGIGKVASAGRVLMKRLADLPPEEFGEAAKTLRFCADAIRDRHNAEITETWLGQRKRKDEHAHL